MSEWAVEIDVRCRATVVVVADTWDEACQRAEEADPWDYMDRLEVVGVTADGAEPE